ncbi:LysR family transcriptional regulator [Endozoicomonadaceae bacterium StTr2]
MSSRVRWDDLRIAYEVAISGSLSKAGKVLGMNHATVLRHINALEQGLDVKLFLRHQRGYQLTDAGRLLISEMPDIVQRFNRLESLLDSAEKHLSGPLVITTVNDYIPSLTSSFKLFRDIYPEVQLQIIATDDILPLSSGSAHVSLRMGHQPDDPDLIANALTSYRISYYAADSYVKAYGMPQNETQYNEHFWVMPSGAKQKIPFIRCMLDLIDDSRLAYQSNSFVDLQAALIEGMGIGPMLDEVAAKHPHLWKLDCFPVQEGDGMWFCYHRDMKSNIKIQALYTFLDQRLPKV